MQETDLFLVFVHRLNHVNDISAMLRVSPERVRLDALQYWLAELGLEVLYAKHFGST